MRQTQRCALPLSSPYVSLTLFLPLSPICSHIVTPRTIFEVATHAQRALRALVRYVNRAHTYCTESCCILEYGTYTSVCRRASVAGTLFSLSLFFFYSHSRTLFLSCLHFLLPTAIKMCASVCMCKLEIKRRESVRQRGEAAYAISGQSKRHLCMKRALCGSLQLCCAQCAWRGCSTLSLSRLGFSLASGCAECVSEL